MSDESSIDMKTLWCASCKGYTEYKIDRAREGGGIAYCNKCGDQMWSASSSKLTILISKIFFPLLLISIIAIPIFIGFSVFDSSIFISFGILVAAITYRVCFYKYTKHLRAFNDWARRQALTKSED